MSKIGRKPIALGDVIVDLKGNEIFYKGKTSSGSHTLPKELSVELIDGKKMVIQAHDFTDDSKRLWGLHRALLANKIRGAQELFSKGLIIEGLGYKAVLTGNKLQLSLGFSHKINFELPENITVQIDKTGQNLNIKGVDVELVGKVASQIRDLKPPEPYKGKGIRYSDEVIIRKAGKAKSA